jgi:hypothetical protein
MKVQTSVRLPAKKKHRRKYQVEHHRKCRGEHHRKYHVEHHRKLPKPRKQLLRRRFRRKMTRPRI